MTKSYFCVFKDSQHSYWSCSQCGRTMPKTTDSPPMAPCRNRDLTPSAAADPFVPRYSRNLEPTPSLTVTGGAGTELKRILAKLGIRASSACACNAYAAAMDAWGPDKTQENMETVIGWLESEATKRKLPFSKFIAKQLIKAAIRKARANASSRVTP